MSSFVKQGDVRQEAFDWGTIGWRLTPSAGSKHLVIMDVTLEPGEGHAFHRHPGQEEMIIVKEGEITQYIEQDSTSLGAGDSVYLDEGVSTRRTTTVRRRRISRS
jgi:quercetin dioxygenase-like cupin family protein